MKKRYYVYAAVICTLFAIAILWNSTNIKKMYICFVPFIFGIIEVWESEIKSLWKKFCKWHTWELDPDDDRF